LVEFKGKTFYRHHHHFGGFKNKAQLKKIEVENSMIFVMMYVGKTKKRKFSN